MSFYEEAIVSSLQELSTLDSLNKYRFNATTFKNLHELADCSSPMFDCSDLFDKDEKLYFIRVIDDLCPVIMSNDLIDQTRRYVIIGHLMYLRVYIASSLQTTPIEGDRSSYFDVVTISGDTVHKSVTTDKIIRLFTKFANNDFSIYDCDKELHSMSIRNMYRDVVECLSNANAMLSEDSRMFLHFAELIFKSSDMPQVNKDYILLCHKIAVRTINNNAKRTADFIITKRMIKLFAFFAHGFFFDPVLNVKLCDYVQSYVYCYNVLRDINKIYTSKVDVKQVIKDIEGARDIINSTSSNVLDSDDTRNIVQYHNLVLNILREEL